MSFRPRLAIALGFLVSLSAAAVRAQEPAPAAPAPESAAPQAATAPLPTPAAPPPRRRYFYFGYDYGSQALYNPLWVFINRGWDVVQDHVVDRNVFSLEYRHNAANVLHNLAHPFSAISDLGWKNFLTTEIFPLNWTERGARWTPNYSLHLLGGGMTYSGLREWYEDHGLPWPRAWSAATVMVTALLNESIENKGVHGRNTDAIADMWVFDIGGIILFSFDAVNRLFSDYLIMSDWSLQPSLTFPRGELHNMGNYFALKWPLPFYKRLRIFSYFGEATTFGLSFLLDGEYSVTLAGGGVATRLVNELTDKVQNVVTFAPTAIAFLDRRESLLASLQVSDLQDYFIHLNVYPHTLTRRGPAVGVWGVMDRRGRVGLGFCLGILGFGGGYSGLARGY
jgi:hypothetical protein